MISLIPREKPPKMPIQKNSSPEERIADYLKRIATGPELSKDLTLEEALDGMTLILEGLVSNVQAAVFLIALRMKRETDEENRGILKALRQATRASTAPIPELVELADPYDGFNRHMPASPFLPPIFAACGVPTVSHGCHQMGPKFGITHHQILSAAGAKIDLTSRQAASRIADPQIGWAYIDQKMFCPPLHRLVELRRLIVKRPCLSTLEKLCGPIRAQQTNHLVIGYVHQDYKRLLPLMARFAGYDSALVIRGVEGGIVPPLNSPAVGTFYNKEEETQEFKWDPKEVEIDSNIRSVPFSQHQGSVSENEDERTTRSENWSEACAIQGLEALDGKAGPTRDSWVYTGAILLHSLQRVNNLKEAGNAVRKAIDSMEAKKRFEKGCT
jgi:anthranilate phosphoribosyltransferase